MPDKLETQEVERMNRSRHFSYRVELNLTNQPVIIGDNTGKINFDSSISLRKLNSKTNFPFQLSRNKNYTKSPHNV